ncbi:type II CAAX endopeptidase family protein [Xanthobacteraceae bacterium Astr-EGSB]|uniref:CPBP family intramembrane glutamic endopeptidase n=1 Tax=Astrobacterium formosum TaxID=3069710 RepID=UPI0027AEE4B7|nr:type II CAAX endopeptidase family protein [Xanthobacteraceae bacterium Astr-EGSB]
MAIQQSNPSAVSEQRAETIAQSETARRLIFIAVGWCVLAGFASGFLVGFVNGFLRVQNASLSPPLAFTIQMLLATGILLIAVKRQTAILGHGNRRIGVDDGPITRRWLLCVLTLLATMWAFFASFFWNAALPQSFAAWRNESSWTLAGFAIGAVTLAPLAEELFYRGWLWKGLRQHWRAFPTSLLTGGFWLLAHIERGILLLGMLLPVAVLLGLTRHFCGIRAAIIVHALYNLVGILVLILLRRAAG